jgi:uncharacterized membrane protein
MRKTRLEAFSDGVIAIIITIMVLEMKVPKDTDIQALRPLVPVLMTYVLSYVMVGIYWSNHHHLLHAAERVDGRILWANLHLLFWLSLVPFVTRWLGQNPRAAWPTALYGVVMWMAAVGYTVLQRSIVSHHGRTSALAAAIGRAFKEKVSLAAYTAAIPLAFYDQRISDLLYVAVALMWFYPDRRIERVLKD